MTECEADEKCLINPPLKCVPVTGEISLIMFSDVTHASRSAPDSVQTPNLTKPRSTPASQRSFWAQWTGLRSAVGAQCWLREQLTARDIDLMNHTQLHDNTEKERGRLCADWWQADMRNEVIDQRLHHCVVSKSDQSHPKLPEDILSCFNSCRTAAMLTQ